MFLRGTVTDNQDPMQRGRVRVQVWGVHKEKDDNLPWAEVMGSTAFPLHKGMGVASVIPVDATVWVAFEHSDMNCPIVVGIFVGHDAETMDAANPGNSDFQGGAGAGGDYGTKQTISTGGGALIELDDKNGTVKMESNGLGVKVDSKKREVSLSNGMVNVELRGPAVFINGVLFVDKVVETKGGLGGIL